MSRRRNEVRNAAFLILKLRIIVAVRSEDRFLYANFSASPLLAIAPSLHLLWRRHCLVVNIKLLLIAVVRIYCCAQKMLKKLNN